MTQQRFSDDDFFDENGDLIKTSWQLDAEEEQRKEEERQRKREEEESLKETNRRFAIDERRAEFEKTINSEQRKRKVREEWMKLPKWVRALPRTPLTDPPTEGRKEKLLYSLTGKVTLTENEMNQRKKDLKKMKIAIADFETIHRPFPYNTSVIPVAVVPIGGGVGSTLLSRTLSRVFAENRLEYGISIVVDLGGKGNKLPDWYEKTDRTKMVLKYILSYIREHKGTLGTVGETFRMGGDGEFYIFNHSAPERRVDPTLNDVVDLYRYMKPTSGIAMFDCDYQDKDSLLGAVALAKTRIFVLPIAADAPQLLMETLNDIRAEVGDDRYKKIRDSSILVISGLAPSTSTPKGKSVLNNLLKECSSQSGISMSRTIVIPHDPVLVNPPLRWEKLNFSTAHAFRWIAGRIVSDVVGEYDGVSKMTRAAGGDPS